MLAEDMGDRQSRISLAREAAVRFARRRIHDELSLVAFGSEALTRVPPTTDRELIVQGVESLEIQLVRDGTDISCAILTSVSRLLESEREPRVVVLLASIVLIASANPLLALPPDGTRGNIIPITALPQEFTGTTAGGALSVSSLGSAACASAPDMPGREVIYTWIAGEAEDA
jgi:hypothetical protein